MARPGAAIVAGLVGVAGIAGWLLLAGPDALFGIDSGHAGTALLVAAAWGALYAISRMPRDAVDAIPPAEWKAWIGLGFSTVAVAYFAVHLPVFAHGSPWDNPAAARVGRNLVVLLVGWMVLGGVLRSRWRGGVEEDERDRRIASRSQAWGYGALATGAIGLAVTLGLSPPERLGWATHFMIGNLLVAGLMVACFVEYAVQVGLYRWGRH